MVVDLSYDFLSFAFMNVVILVNYENKRIYVSLWLNKVIVWNEYGRCSTLIYPNLWNLTVRRSESLNHHISVML